MNPSQRELSAETIGELSGGGFGVAINKQIDKLTKDIGDYPVDYRGKPVKRKLVIELEFEPSVKFHPETQSHDIQGIGLRAKVEGKMPPRGTGAHDVRIVRGRPCFNVDSPDDFYQETFGFEEPAES